MADFIFVPDQGVTKRPKFRVRKAKFGDGYVQRSADGINSIEEVWDMAFTLRTRTEIEAIEVFIRSKKGISSFTWQTPSGDTIRVTCDTYTTTYNHDLNCSATATFEQVFET